ncbi:MAG TPA: phosphoribosylformylglycinamidine synthase [Microscillaceae bacterium]|nr:phosphoribosylformylglycinamidine synthase [Microscillaceae bacterium]
MKILHHTYITLFILLLSISALAQSSQPTTTPDSIRVQTPKAKQKPDKVLHAEPLYIDLIRDLGARKGEKEWNVGLGITDNETYDQYEALIEYEWAPIDRLGLEVELPFSLYYPTNGNEVAPGSRLNSVKLAAQYSFFVSKKYSTSLAIGYIHEFELIDFARYNQAQVFTGNVYNPFLIAAKRWGHNFHTLVYTGPSIQHHFQDDSIQTRWQINSNVHYMIPGTKNFIGVEFNKTLERADFDMTLRPQMRVSVADNLLIGIVVGIPVHRENERFSSFLRLIYEPGHKKNHL